MNYLLDSILSPFTSGVWTVVKAALILVVALIVSAVVKSLVLKLLNKIKLGAKFEGDEAEKTKTFIGKLTYLLVFLLFVPDIFSALGMNSISSPITGLLNTIWGYVPNILAAVIILIVGFMVARLVRQLLIPMFNKIKVDKLQEKAGMNVPETAKLSSTLAYIVYVLILIPVIITALNALSIESISQPAIGMLSTIINFIPNIVVGLIIIIVGCMIGKFGGQIVEKLVATSGLDTKLTSILDGKMQKFQLSKLVGIVVQTVIIIFFVVEGINILHLQVLTNVGAAIISYIPYLLAATLILAGSLILSSVAAKLLDKYGRTYAMLARCAILTIGSFMILSQLGIASKLVNATFILVIGALAVAFALAFGLGGRTFASNMLKRLEDKTCGIDSEKKEEDS
jgi:mechanosensitive ion channel-like protein